VAAPRSVLGSGHRELGAVDRIFTGVKATLLYFIEVVFLWGLAPKPPGLTTFEGLDST
jgi:hypothetical protein